jgi:hypothetical protein
MNNSARTIIRSFLALALLAVIGMAASPAAQAQCNSITITVEKVFPLADDSFIGTMTLLFPLNKSYSYPFSVVNNGTQVSAYNPMLGVPGPGVLSIMGANVASNSTAIVPGPPGFPSCLCLEVSFTINPTGCVIVHIRPVCC